MCIITQVLLNYISNAINFCHYSLLVYIKTHAKYVYKISTDLICNERFLREHSNHVTYSYINHGHINSGKFRVVTASNFPKTVAKDITNILILLIYLKNSIRKLEIWNNKNIYYYWNYK